MNGFDFRHARTIRQMRIVPGKSYSCHAFVLEEKNMADDKGSQAICMPLC